MVSWHPGDNTVLVTASEDGTVKNWFYPNSRLNMTLPHNNLVEAALWANDGSRLITGDDDGLAHVWDMTNSQPIIEWTAHEGDIITMALSPDNSRLVTTGNDGFLRVWNPDTGDELGAFTADLYNPVAPAWLPDSQNLALTFDNNWLGLWQVGNPEASRIIRAHTGPITSLAWTPEGRGIAAGYIADNMTYLWNLATMDLAATLPGFTADAKGISISADGHFDRRLPGGPVGSSGQGRSEPVTDGDQPADGWCRREVGWNLVWRSLRVLQPK
jgi:WD40 repeat protein